VEIPGESYVGGQLKAERFSAADGNRRVRRMSYKTRGLRFGAVRVVEGGIEDDDAAAFFVPGPDVVYAKALVQSDARCQLPLVLKKEIGAFFFHMTDEVFCTLLVAGDLAGQ
jgi:hypothetical protein